MLPSLLQVYDGAQGQNIVYHEEDSVGFRLWLPYFELAKRMPNDALRDFLPQITTRATHLPLNVPKYHNCT